MKSFKVYLREGGTNTQLIWLGSLMLIIAIVISSLSVYNYFTMPQEPFEEFAFSPHALMVKELYLSSGIGIIGVVLLLAGAFSANSTKSEKDEKIEQKEKQKLN